MTSMLLKTKEKCPYYKWPSCHPAQVGPEDVFCCIHVAWPQNEGRYNKRVLIDFEPIVSCGGDPFNCEIPRWWMTKEEEAELGLDKIPEIVSG